MKSCSAVIISIVRCAQLDNVLIDHRGGGLPIVKLCDFGYSKAENFGSGCKTACGTPEYMAPEVGSLPCFTGQQPDASSHSMRPRNGTLCLPHYTLKRMRAVRLPGATHQSGLIRSSLRHVAVAQPVSARRRRSVLEMVAPAYPSAE